MQEITETQRYFHDFISIIGVLVPVLLYLVNDRKKMKQHQDKLHLENAAKLDEIIRERQYLPQHFHIEKEGALNAEGIIRKPANGSLR